MLAIERRRLEVAREIEERRQIVFPETSVIVHDILKLVAALDGKPALLEPEESDLFDGLLEPL